MRQDTVKLGPTIETLVNGTKIIRLVDRDDRSAQEILDLEAEGVRVLSKRHLEAYLMSNEILSKLCNVRNRPDAVQAILSAKQQAITDSVGRLNQPDDIKSASGPIFVEVRNALGLTQAGNTSAAFMRDTLALLVTPDTSTYAELKHDIFNE